MKRPSLKPLFFRQFQKPELLVYPPLEKKVALKKQIDPESQHEIVLKLTEVLVDEEKARRNSIHIEVGSTSLKQERVVACLIEATGTSGEPDEFKPNRSFCMRRKMFSSQRTVQLIGAEPLWNMTGRSLMTRRVRLHFQSKIKITAV